MRTLIPQYFACLQSSKVGLGNKKTLLSKERLMLAVEILVDVLRNLGRCGQGEWIRVVC